MSATIFPSEIHGTLKVPPSKSVMQRVCALALMNRGTTLIFNYGNSDDDRVSLEVVRQCGAIVTTSTDHLVIESSGNIQAAEEISFGESGLSSRLFTPLLATTSQKVQLHASGSLLNRGMDPMIKSLQQQGVKVVHQNGHFPMSIQGPMTIGSIDMDGSSSSQHITGFLFAMSYQANATMMLQLKSAVSKPYIELSITWLKRFGYSIESNESLDRLLISPRQPMERNLQVSVESDWSSASFLIVAALLAGDLLLKGLDIQSLQADKKILEVLQAIQAPFDYTYEVLSVKKIDHVSSFQFDATDCPDLFPPLAVLAAYATGTSTIKGALRLSNKESDRGKAIQQELGKLGVAVTLDDDEMYIHGTGTMKGGLVDAHDDHRMAMALSVAGLRASGAVTVEGVESVNKSFPGFFKALKEIHVRLDYSIK